MSANDKIKLSNIKASNLENGDGQNSVQMKGCNAETSAELNLVAFNDRTIEKGRASFASGFLSEASGTASYAGNCLSKASGMGSHAQNRWTIANVDYSTAIGSFNKNLSSGDYFAIGNGVNLNTRSNALRVTSSGATYGQGAFNTSGADYAEYFEWQDKNTENEDRVGLFVTFDNEDKIIIANFNDDYILGIISATPTVIGNSYNDQWQGMNVRDDFGRVQYHEVEIPEQKRVIHHEAEYESVIDEDTKETTQKLIREAYDEEMLICEARKEYSLY